MLTAWLVVAVYALFIFAVSAQSRPLEFLGGARFAPDWLFHVVEYGLLGYFLARAFDVTFRFGSRLLLLVITLIFGTLYGLTDEWHQSFVPERQASARDLVADAAGVAIGSMFMRKRRKESDG